MTPVFPQLDDEDKTFYACLALQHRLGYAGFTRLMEVYRSPRKVYGASSEELKTAYPRLDSESATSIAEGPKLKAWEKIQDRCHQIGARFAAPGSPEYPQPLCTLSAPPPLLFIQGSWVQNDRRAVAVVGTRHPTDYGRKAAFDLSRDLAHEGVTVVSGFAIGIDAEAHSGALKAGGRTLAVIGCGLDVPYPQGNDALRAHIVESGAILSEFPPGAHPRRDHFPRRNRILSALAQAVVVVEAGERSGALLTAAHARAQGKTLLAVPGSIFSGFSAGTHTLLRRGARLAASAEDIFAALGEKSAPVIPEIEKEPVLDLWQGENICAMDRLAERARESGAWPAAKVLAALTESLLRLEMRGLIRRLPGPAFVRVKIGMAGYLSN